MSCDPPSRPPLPPEPPVRQVRGRGLWRWLPGPRDLTEHYDRVARSWHLVQRLSGYLGAFRDLAAGLVADGTLPGTSDGSLVDRLRAAYDLAANSVDTGAARDALARWAEASGRD